MGLHNRWQDHEIFPPSGFKRKWPGYNHWGASNQQYRNKLKGSREGGGVSTGTKSKSGINRISIIRHQQQLSKFCKRLQTSCVCVWTETLRSDVLYFCCCCCFVRWVAVLFLFFFSSKTPGPDILPSFPTDYPTQYRTGEPGSRQNRTCNPCCVNCNVISLMVKAPPATMPPLSRGCPFYTALIELLLYYFLVVCVQFIDSDSN